MKETFKSSPMKTFSGTRRFTSSLASAVSLSVSGKPDFLSSGELSPAGSPARTFPTQASAPELPEPVRGCGGRWCVAFAWWDKERLTLNGVVKLWPTPRSEDSQCAGNHPGAMDSLHAAVKLFPTPMPSDVTGGRTTKGKHRQNETGLRRAIWPTPTADDANNVTRASGDYQSLTREVFRTPQKRDWKGQTSEKWAASLADQTDGQLNPTWVEWLMGYPSEWTVLRHSATPSSRNASRKSSKG